MNPRASVVVVMIPIQRHVKCVAIAISSCCLSAETACKSGLHYAQNRRTGLQTRPDIKENLTSGRDWSHVLRRVIDRRLGNSPEST